MNGLIEWFAKNGVAANLLAIFIAIVGVMTIGTLRQEVFPEFSSDIISVRVVYPGAAPEEVEEGISQKIEEVIHGLIDVKKITSTSQENSSTVMVELNPGTDAARALDEIKTRIDAIDTFPEEAEKPLIEEIIMRKQVINVAVSGEATEKTDPACALRGEDPDEKCGEQWDCDEKSCEHLSHHPSSSSR